MELIEKLARGIQISDSDIASELFTICDRVHSTCDVECPVYRLNGNSAVGADKPFEQNRGCDCFKNGRAMLDFIRNH